MQAKSVQDCKATPTRWISAGILYRRPCLLRISPAIFIGLFSLFFLPYVATAQFANPPEPQLSGRIGVEEVDNALRAHLERTEQLVKEKKWDDALDTLGRLQESDGQKLIRLSSPSARRGGAEFVRFVTLRDFGQRWLAAQSRAAPELLRLQRERVDPLARRWYEQGIAQHNPGLLKQVVEQMFVSSYTDDALLRLGDWALERGDYVGARGAWQRIHPALSSPIDGGPLWLALRDVNWATQRDEAAAALQNAQPLGLELVYPDTDIALPDLLARLTLVSIMEGASARATVELNGLRQLFPDATGQLAGRRGKLVELLDELQKQSATWPERTVSNDWLALGGSPSRNRHAASEVDMAGKPTWSATLPLFDGTNDRLATSRARVAEDQKGLLSHHPVVVGPNVFVSDVDRVRTFQLHSGKPAWPTAAASNNDVELGTIYQTPLAAAELQPRRHAGVPRFTLFATEQRLFARMASPITGLDEDDRIPRKQRGYLVGLDLAAQGRTVFRRELDEEEFNDDWAFEGPPVCDGAFVYVTLRRRDAVRDQTHIASFDLRNGKLRWRRFLCAAESPRRNMAGITHNLLTLAQGVLYCNTNLGSVAALACDDGTIQWLTQYPRTSYHAALPDRTDRQFYRDLNPCLLHDGLLYVIPTDCDRLFALEAATGRVIWSTDGERALDAVHLLGVGHGNLIVSGDYLYWFDAVTGRPVGQFPQPRKEAPGFALASPRGYGRGLLVGEHVWFPTRDKLLVFHQQTKRHDNQWLPSAIREIELTQRGATGGNLLIADGVLLIATPDKLYAFGE